MGTNKYLVDQWRDRARHWRKKGREAGDDKYLLREIWLARAGVLDQVADELEESDKHHGN